MILQGILTTHERTYTEGTHQLSREGDIEIEIKDLGT